MAPPLAHECSVPVQVKLLLYVIPCPACVGHDMGKDAIPIDQVGGFTAA